MLKWFAYMNRMFKKSSIDIGHNFEVTQTRYVNNSWHSNILNPNNTVFSGVEVVPESEDDLDMARSARSDEETISFLIADKIWNFLRSRTLRYKMMDDADILISPEPRGNLNIGVSINANRAFESGRGRIRTLAPIIAAVATKVGIIGALVLKALVLLVGKALIISKVALLLAVIIGLKKLLSKKHVTYEVVAHPHHSESHHASPSHDSYSTAGWGRALEGFFDGLESIPAAAMPDAQEQAYAGQARSI